MTQGTHGTKGTLVTLQNLTDPRVHGDTERPCRTKESKRLKTVLAWLYLGNRNLLGGSLVLAHTKGGYLLVIGKLKSLCCFKQRKGKKPLFA